MTPQLDTLAELLAYMQPYFEKVAALDANQQPHWPNGARPFSAGDVRHISEQFTSLRDNLPAIREQADEVERLRQIIRRMKGEAEDRPRQPDEAYFFFAMRMVKRLDAIESMANAALNPTQENGNG